MNSSNPNSHVDECNQINNVVLTHYNDRESVATLAHDGMHLAPSLPKIADDRSSYKIIIQSIEMYTFIIMLQ
jgi:hypothetical protein